MINEEIMNNLSHFLCFDYNKIIFILVLNSNIFHLHILYFNVIILHTLLNLLLQFVSKSKINYSQLNNIFL